MAQKTIQDLERERKIAELKKAIERAEGRGQRDTSYHTLLEQMLGKPAPMQTAKADKETKE